MTAGSSDDATVTLTPATDWVGDFYLDAHVDDSIPESTPFPVHDAVPFSLTVTGSADLQVTTTDSMGGSSVTPSTGTAVAGQPITYTVTVSNKGTTNVTGVSLVDTLPAAVSGATYTITPSSGAADLGSGGNQSLVAGQTTISDDDLSISAGSTVTFVIKATVNSGATGSLTSTAVVSPPSGVTLTNLTGNSATDNDTVVAPPVVTPSGTVNTYTVGGAAVAVDSGVTVGFSGSDLTGATVAISSGTFQSGDTLNFTNQSGITSSYANGTLTLSGTATPTQYQTALQSITFSTTSTNIATRAITIVALDNAASSNSAAESVKVVAPPVVTASGTTNTFTLGGSAVAVDSGLTVSFGSGDLTGATLTISSGTLQTGDALNFTNQNGITGTYSDGKLTLSGSATPAQYQTALQSVKFSTTSDNTTTRAIAVVAVDDSLASTSTAENVKVAIAAPVVTASGAVNTFTIDGAAVAVDSGVMVTSFDADLTGATVTISTGTLQTGDALNFTNQNGISGTFSDGKLTLTGSATPAQYQTALQSVTFSTTNTSSSVTRSLTIVALDNSLSSNSATESVKVITAPVVTPSGTTKTFNIGGAAVAVDSGVTVTSNATDLTGATVTISSGTLQTGDTLNFTSQNGITGSYSDGELTLSGSATPTQYQTALQSVTFSTTDANTTTRAITIVALDNSLSSDAATESVKVQFTPPVVTASGSINTFTVGGAAVAVDSGVTVTSAETNVTGATVTISLGTLQSGDTLNFSSQNGITSSYSDGVLTLSGTATAAQYQTALQSVTFSTTSNSPVTRSLTIVALYDASTSNPADESVKVIAAPVVTPSGSTSTFLVGGTAVAVDSGITVSSNDTHLTGATVTISSGTFQTGDTLNFTTQNGITGSYSGGVLTLSGSATPAQYQAALQSVTFSTTSANTTARAISIVAVDNALSSTAASETVHVAISAPVVTPSGTTSTFTIGGSSVAVDSGVKVTSSDTDLTGATVTISPGTLQSGDSLNFTSQNGITGSYTGGVLTLSGSATPAQYQTVLRSVTFATNNNSSVARSITVAALDNSLSSNAAAETVKVLTLPVVTASGKTNTFTIGGSAVAVDSGVTVTSDDADLTGATVTISSGTLQSGDTLNFTSQNGITGSYSGGVLTLSGSATPAQYQTALQSVKFSSTSANSTARAISILALDNSLASNLATETVDVSVAPPVVTPSGTTKAFTIGGSSVAVDSGLDVSSSDSDLTGATVTISSGTLQSADTLNFSAQNGITGSYSGGVLTLSGSATPAQYQTALRSVTFDTNSNSSVARSITIVALDGSLTSNAAAESVNVITAPVVTASGKTNTFSVGGSAVAVDSGVTVSSDDADLTGATLTISSGTLQTGDTLNFTTQNGITASYSSGVLTLSGSATPAQYQTALESVTFSTTSSNATARSISAVALDGTLASAAALESVEVTATSASLSGTAYNDANRSGVFTDGEVVLANATITLTGTTSGGTAVNQTAQTSSNGTFSFSNLAAGTYALSAQFPTNLNSGVATAGNEGGTVLDEVVSGITLAAGAVGTGYNFGAYGLAPKFITINDFLASSLSLSQMLNQEPTVSTLANQTVDSGTSTPATSFTVGDSLASASSLTVTGTSSNTTLVPAANIVYAGTGADRTITVTPAAGQTGTATITTTVADPYGNQTAVSFTLTVSASITVTPSGTANTFTIGNSPVAVDSGVKLTSVETDLTGATLTISSGTLQSGDTLNFTSQNGITGTYASGVLTLSGTATPAQYQTALESVTFSTTSTNTTARSISIVAADNAIESSTASETVDVTMAAPVVTPSGTNSTFTVGGSAVAVDSGVKVTSSDADLTGATETISSGTFHSGDTLDFTNQNGISGSYASGVLTLTGSATPAQYQSALQSVTFSTTSSSDVTRSIAIVALDNSLTSNSATESVTVIAAPVVTPSGAASTFTIGGSAVPLDSGVTVTSNTTDLTGATLTISTGTFQSGDTLNFSNQNGITGNFSGGVLTLSGSATPAQYQAALQSVTFSTTSSNTTPRAISIVAVDNSLSSTAAAETVNVSFPAPVVTPSGTTSTFTVGGSAVAVDSGVTVTSSDADLTGATETISSGTLQSGDTFNFTNQNGITGSYANGVLTLSGSATPAQYQAALQSVTFSTASDSSVARAITIVALDNSLSSNSAAESVNIIAPPVVTPSGTQNTYTIGGSAVPVDSGVKVSSNDTDLTGATVTIASSDLQSGDMLNFVNESGITGNYAAGTLTLSGSATPAQYQTALQSVTFSTTSTSSITRSIAIVADDNSLASISAAESIAISPTGTPAAVTTSATQAAVDAALESEDDWT